MKTDFLVLGSGIAGISTALRLSTLGKVTVLTKGKEISGSSPLAQGGIAAGISTIDIRDHFQDTLFAGAHHNTTKAVEALALGAKEALDFLRRYGVSFSESLHREGGHSENRIWHVHDYTGKSIMKILLEAVRKNDHIFVQEETFVSDFLIRDGALFGVEAISKGEVQRFFASRVVLATGGAGQIYAETTSPLECTGDGIAMARRSGAEIKDMEFVQFHPTALSAEESPLFLLTEALRGEGAKLVTITGEEVCDPLLPRDEVSRSIFLSEQRGIPVYLDLREKPQSFWERHFPSVSERLSFYNINPEQEIVPILPAAHFFCGGVMTDLRGRTTLQKLSAVGEVACSGVHGANRLASNSLLEGLVFSRLIFEDFQEQVRKDKLHPPDDSGHFETRPFTPETREDTEIRKQIQRLCWKYLGIIRSPEGEEQAKEDLARLTPTGTETKNMLAVATFVAQAACQRKESLGCHFVTKKK
ncbi:FAD-dependent oxidoreductase [Candidatus Peregrinibacteria bacterium]|nr:MAG: FAD-dependent oxidoreductase [Candidatus Peregrinibacteria bacterium]